MNLVISDPKSGKAFSHKTEEKELFANKKVGEEIDLDSLGFQGYVAVITGGSDKEGFPIKRDLEGPSRRKVFVTVDKKKGVRRRITFRGNQLTAETTQVNLSVRKYGAKPFAELLPKVKVEEKTLSAKEELIAKSMANVERSKEEVLKEREAGEGGIKKAKH